MVEQQSDNNYNNVQTSAQLKKDLRKYAPWIGSGLVTAFTLGVIVGNAYCGSENNSQQTADLDPIERDIEFLDDKLEEEFAQVDQQLADIKQKVEQINRPAPLSNPDQLSTPNQLSFAQ